MDNVNVEVLILNKDYEPLNLCSQRRAISLLMVGKVEVVHQNGGRVRTIRGDIPLPSVIRMRYHIKRPLPQLHLSRQTILARDMYTCQYCGISGKDLTIDHIVPRYMGGPAAWDNLVACCRRCNLRKGDKTVSQAGMKLLKQPRRPKYIPYISLPKYLRAIHVDDWKDYLPIFDEFVIQA